MKNFFALVSAVAIAYHVQSQDQQLFFVGHSLADYIPEMMISLAESDNQNIDYGYAQIIGSPLRYQWSCLNQPGNWPGNFEDANIYAFYDPTNGLPTGRYDHLILNEGVPRTNDEWGIEETFRYVDSFYQYALQYNPNIQLYLSELWHCLDSGTPTGCDFDVDSRPWRQRLDDDLPMWERAIDFINDKYSPDPPMQLIPSGQALAALDDSIRAGRVQGVSSMDQFFEDRIHGNDSLRYLVACVNYASVMRRSPIGLTHETKTWWGGDFGAIPLAMARQLQNIAWQTVCDYPRNNVDCIVSNTDQQLEQWQVFPNPSGGQIGVIGAQPGQLSIINLAGQEVFSSKIGSAQSLTLDMDPGVYHIKIQTAQGQLSQLLVVH